MDSDFFVDGSRHLALQPFDSPTSFSLKSLSPLFFSILEEK